MVIHTQRSEEALVWRWCFYSKSSGPEKLFSTARQHSEYRGSIGTRQHRNLDVVPARAAYAVGVGSSRKGEVIVGHQPDGVICFVRSSCKCHFFQPMWLSGPDGGSPCGDFVWRRLTRPARFEVHPGCRLNCSKCGEILVRSSETRPAAVWNRCSMASLSLAYSPFASVTLFTL